MSLTKIYSYSRLNTFEQCPFKFKCRYIEQIKPDFEKSIEAHLGTAVHESLEWLYKNVKDSKIPTLDSLIEHYANVWTEQFSDDIKVVSQFLEVKDYFNKGVQYLINYYAKHKPFQDGTIDLEMEIILDLDNTGKYQLHGFIDRLSFNEKTNEYEIHDYKTGSLPRDMKKFETDRQLAIYSIAIKEIFGKDKKVCLVWHYLSQDQRICSYRTNEQLEKLKEEIKKIIDKIEITTDFKPCPSQLCNWCEYKSNCPAFQNEP